MSNSMPPVLGAWWALILAAVSPPVVAPAQDTVLLKAESGEDGGRIRGEIVDFTGAKLTLRHPSGRQEVLDTTRVGDIVTSWNEAVREGDEHFATEAYTKAASAYRAGLREETRRWAQRRILARLVWCLRYEGRFEAACEAFLALYRDDPTTQYIEAMPLVWTRTPPSGALAEKAKAWMADRQQPAAQLLGASWLLSSDRRGEALSTLRGLGGNDARLLYLAESQLWRTEIPTATPDELVAWQVRVQRMPASIRAGGYFLLGQAWSQAGDPQEAVWAYLRLPILYPQQRMLAAQSLLEAATQLEKMNQQEQATVLYREAASRFAETVSADVARKKLAVFSAN